MAQITVHHRFIHQAPRKLRLVSGAVQGLPAEVAIAELGATPKVAAKTLKNLIISGVAAAKERGMSTAQLVIAEISVDEGPKLRRFNPLSRGRSQRILKRMSHLHLSLTDEALHKPDKPVVRKTTSEAPAGATQSGKDKVERTATKTSKGSK